MSSNTSSTNAGSSNASSSNATSSNASSSNASSSNASSSNASSSNASSGNAISSNASCSSDSLTKVQNSLSGYVYANNNLKLYQNANVVVRSDFESLDPSIVRIITGGGSGHEPAHSGYVGHGMLTAAVCGEIFASPSVVNILSAILSVAKPGSPILLIVTNYTGDRLNFGLAGEIAKTKYGYKVETLLIDDDCAIENVQRSVGKRGLAGTVLIHKIAGAMAANGSDLKEIYTVCSDILTNERLATVGFTFTTTGDRIKSIEIGKGVHGEPGIQMLDDEPDFGNIIEIVVQKLMRKLPYSGEKSKVLVMFNNLGGTSAFTMATFANFFLQRIRGHFDIELVLEGTFMTSLNAEGISVTLLHFLDEHKDDLIENIKYTVNIAANVPFNINRSFDLGDCVHDDIVSANPFDKINLNERFYEMECKGFWRDACTRAVVCACERLIQHKDRLNEMDTQFGDGDTGTLVAAGCSSIQLSIIKGKVDVFHPAVMLHDMSALLQTSMGGSLGALLSIFLRAASAAAFTNGKGMTFWLYAMKLGMDAVQKYGLAQFGDRTMLDALDSGVDLMALRISERHSSFESIEAFAIGCQQGANKTKHMIPKAGRASYSVSDGKKFTPNFNDPGAEVVAIAAKGVYDGLRIAFQRGF